jgi:hypothetical protein
MEVKVMKDWMTIDDLSNYLETPPKKIRQLIKIRGIPFYDKLGTPRFFKKEIDDWMRAPVNQSQKTPAFLYRGKDILEYALTASKVLCGQRPLKRLPDFIRKAVTKADVLERPYLYRKEFEPLIDNYNDYLRLSFWLGLIDTKKEGREKFYYPTEYSRRICAANDLESIRRIILDSIHNLVMNGLELIPDERHAIFLLWYLLKLKRANQELTESQFRIDKDKPASFYPSIRLNFAKGLCDFLFGKDKEREQEFLKRWEKDLKLRPA